MVCKRLLKRRRRLVYLDLGERVEFTSPFHGQEFSLLLWSARPSTIEEKLTLAKQIVDQGCRNAVCGGQDCEVWHDAIDEVRPEEPLVMTTWHDEESINTVAKYFNRHADFSENYTASRYIVVFLGSDLTERDRLFHAVGRVFKFRQP
jgi:hypothetical protein